MNAIDDSLREDFAVSVAQIVTQSQSQSQGTAGPASR